MDKQLASAERTLTLLGAMKQSVRFAGEINRENLDEILCRHVMGHIEAMVGTDTAEKVKLTYAVELSGNGAVIKFSPDDEFTGIIIEPFTLILGKTQEQ